MITLTIARPFFSNLKPLSIRETLAERILQRGKYVIATSSRRRFHKDCLLRYVRKNTPQKAISAVQILRLLRTRRQNVLKAAWVDPLKHPLRSLYFQYISFKLLKELEEILVEMYTFTGDEELFQEVCEARFATHKLLERMVLARHQSTMSSK